MNNDFIGIFGFIFLLALYFLPAFVAAIRNHKNISSITTLNLLLGWTVIGWIGALIWAFTDNTN